MRFEVVSLFPCAFEWWMQEGVIGRAIQKKISSVQFWNPREYTKLAHNRVDDRPFGGGPGMVMSYQPLADCLKAIWKECGQIPVIYLSPQGTLLKQQLANDYAMREEAHFVLVCGRYEGIDERFIERFVDYELSVGDYILSGGELAAMIFMESVIRLLPNALGCAESAQLDSFTNAVLDYPNYTRPEAVDGMRVPDVLRSGDHAAIKQWRYKKALENTNRKRPDLL